MSSTVATMLAFLSEAGRSTDCSAIISGGNRVQCWAIMGSIVPRPLVKFLVSLQPLPTADAAALLTVLRMSSVDRCAKLGKLQRLEKDTDGTEFRPPPSPPINVAAAECGASAVLLLLLLLTRVLTKLLMLLHPVTAVVSSDDSPGSLFRLLSSKGEISMSMSSRLWWCWWCRGTVWKVVWWDTGEMEECPAAPCTREKVAAWLLLLSLMLLLIGSFFTRAGGGGRVLKEHKPSNKESVLCL